MGNVETPTAAKVIFGTNVFGRFDFVPTLKPPFPDADSIIPILDTLQAHGHSTIDTARIYGSGLAEKLLADAKWQERGLKVDTKLYPTRFRPAVMPGAALYCFNAEELRAGLMASLEALNTKKIGTWYLYAPDRSTPFEETMREMNNLYNEGHFERFGLCNFQAWEVAQIQEICIKNNWVRPAVFQGVYNALIRGIEGELFPCLRHYGMAFEAAQPLASGLLTNRYRRDMAVDEFIPGGRFDPDPKNAIGVHMRRRYWHDPFFNALAIIRKAAEAHGLTVNECAFRWLNYHSKLNGSLGDGIVTSATNTKQLEENCVDLAKGPLPEEVVKAFDEAHLKAKTIVMPYWH